MTRPTCTNEEALIQAGWTLRQYLYQARDEIDKVFGEGYAKEHPDLVAASIKFQALDYATGYFAVPFFDIAHALKELSERDFQ